MASSFLQVQTPTQINTPATPLSEVEDFYSVRSYSPTASDYDEQDDEDVENAPLEPPTHPVRSMQAAFEESIDESSRAGHAARQSTDVDASVRRKKLLEKPEYDNAWTARWKQPQGARFHPLIKQIAQILFGMHLLHQQQAKSDEEVVKILQIHVDEIDSFLEKTAEDFDLALGDIEERLRFLKLPMTHLDVFDTMLEDKTFRTQLLDGNDKIEKIVDRTTKAMQGAMHDIRQGKEATKELGRYLETIRDSWPAHKDELRPIYGAMRGNEDGWRSALRDLQSKGHYLGDKLAELTAVVGEMAKLAAAASRRDKAHARSISSSQSEPGSPRLRSRFNRDQPPLPVLMRKRNAAFVNKPLPREPEATGGAAPIRSISKPSTVPFADRYESPRQQPPTPKSPAGTLKDTAKSIPLKTVDATTMTSNGNPPRPRTAGATGMAAREASISSKRETAELAEFLKLSGPLNSNPPDQIARSKHHKGSNSGKDDSLGRSKSQGATDIMNALRDKDNTNYINGHPARSHSQGAATLLSRPKTSGSGSTDSHKNGFGQGTHQSEGIDCGVGRTAFSRRMSKRMKHLPTGSTASSATTPTASAQKPKPTIIAPDSAYGSAADASSFSYTSTPTTATNAYQPRSAPPPLINPRDPSPENQKRKQLALFPSTAPLTPSAASLRSGAAGGSRSVSNATLPVNGDNGDTDSITALPMPSPAGSARLGKSRTFSIRNVFHRKKVSGIF